MRNRSSVTRLSVSALIFALLLAGGSFAFAQQLGAISGTVQDTTGAAVVDASVTVRNAETGASRSLVTDSSGSYRALSLPVGQYDVTVRKTGFKVMERRGITLVVGQQAVIDLTLQVGQVAESVEVTSEVPLVNATTESTAGLVGEREVKALPLNGRSFDTLITLNPGTANTTSYRSTTSTGGGQGNNFSIAGMREDYNIFLMNGIEYTGVSTADVTPGGLSGQLLGVDAVREFNVQQNSYSAEYGKRAGGQVNVVTMSGSNQFHGTAFEFLRNSALDARNYFDQANIAPFKRNQFGGAAGGPIRKDKTFIFGNFEGFIQRLGLSAVAIVPDAQARQGKLPNAQGVYQPVTGLSTAVLPYFALWPNPNGAEILTKTGLPTGAAFSFANPPQKIREDFGNLRVDQVISSKNTLGATYIIDDGFNQSPSNANYFQQLLSQSRSQVLSLQDTHVFSPSVLNVAVAGFSRARWGIDGQPPFDTSSLSFDPGRPVGQISIGAVGFAGGSGSFSPAGSFGAQQKEGISRNLFTYSDNVQISHGRHLWSVGGWVQRVQMNDNAADQQNGVANFASITTFLQGTASTLQATLSPSEIDWRQLEAAWFVQDAIKMRSNLTVTLGLRHEFNNGWNSPSGRASNYYPDPTGVLVTAPFVGHSVYLHNNGVKLFGPRVGIAWQPFSKTAVHAGGGSYYNQLDYMGSCCDAAPFNGVNNKVSASNAKFPQQVTASLPGGKPAPSAVDPNAKTPTVEEWNLSVEQGITDSTVVSVGYVGSHGFHLLDTADINAALPVICPNTACPAGLAAGTKYFPAGVKNANPNLGQARYTLSNANSSYNALQLDLKHRFTRGLQFRANYAWAKSLDDHSSSYLANEGVGGTTTILDPQNPSLDYGRSNFDVRQRLTTNFSYQLPIGRGHSFLGNVQGFADKIVSGWQWNSIFAFQTGFPFTPLVGSNQSRNGDGRAPDRVSINPAFSGTAMTRKQTQWFDPEAFLIPMSGTYGNAGRDILEGPGLASVDTSLFKTTHITERITAQFRAEFFNVINHSNFGMPGISTFSSATCNTVGGCVGAATPSAGLITYTATTSRQIQFGLKLSW